MVSYKIHLKKKQYKNHCFAFAESNPKQNITDINTVIRAPHFAAGMSG